MIPKDRAFRLDENTLRTMLSSDIALFYFDTINSTNDFLRKINDSHTISVCLTRHQYAGKGQHQRQWHDDYGSLLLSIAYRFERSVAVSGLSLVIGLSLATVLKRRFNIDKIALKWPNDVYVNEKKLAGVLIENIWQQTDMKCIIGIGVNICLAWENLKKMPWIDLSTILNTKPDGTQLAAWVINQVIDDCKRFSRHGFVAFKPKWLKYHGINHRHVALTDGRHCQVIGVDDHGALLVNDGRHTLTIHSSHTLKPQ